MFLLQSLKLTASLHLKIGRAPKLTQPMDPEKKSLNFIFPTKYVIPKSLKFSHWPSKKRKRSSSNHPFSGALAVSFREGIPCPILTLHDCLEVVKIFTYISKVGSLAILYQSSKTTPFKKNHPPDSQAFQ